MSVFGQALSLRRRQCGLDVLHAVAFAQFHAGCATEVKSDGRLGKTQLLAHRDDPIGGLDDLRPWSVTP